MSLHHTGALPRLSVAVGLLALMSSSWAALTDEEAINKAGRQRMLSQRIAKSYLMIGAQVNPIEAQKQLDEAVALFEQQHQELLEYASDKSLRDAVAAVEKSWLPFRELALGKPDRARAVTLLKQSDEVLANAERLVQRIETAARARSGHLVNLAGRQRMLSQRIAKLYLAMAWKVPAPSLDTGFNEAMQQYDSALQTLSQAPENTPGIATALRRVQAQWSFSQAGFRQHAEGRYVPTVIMTTTETMLKQMNEVTTSYEQVMRRQRMAHAH